MATTDLVHTARSPHSLRPVGIAGWVATVVLFGGLFLMTGHGAAEPDFGAPTAQIQLYLETRTSGLYAAGAALFVVGLFGLLWFFCGLSAALRRHAAGPQWLPSVVVASGATLAMLLVDATQAAAFQADEGLDPQLSRFAFDLTSITFTNAWVAFGSIALASGWAILANRTEPDSPGRRVWPRWLGWWALAAGAGLIVTRPVWTTNLWLIPVRSPEPAPSEPAPPEPADATRNQEPDWRGAGTGSVFSG
jgi:hypothetical protein